MIIIPCRKCCTNYLTVLHRGYGNITTQECRNKKTYFTLNFEQQDRCFCFTGCQLHVWLCVCHHQYWISVVLLAMGSTGRLSSRCPNNLSHSSPRQRVRLDLQSKHQTSGPCGPQHLLSRSTKQLLLPRRSLRHTENNKNMFSSGSNVNNTTGAYIRDLKHKSAKRAGSVFCDSHFIVQIENAFPKLFWTICLKLNGPNDCPPSSSSGCVGSQFCKV